MKNTTYEDHIKSLYNDAMSAKTDAGKLKVLDLLFRMTANELVAERTAAASFEKMMEEKFGKDAVTATVEDKDIYSNLNLLEALLIYNYLDKAEENEYNVFPLLNDKFFGYEFLNSFDYILYDEREE